MGLSPASVIERIEKDDVVRKVRRHRFAGAVFLVGGALREFALGHTPNDYDFALERSEDLSAFEEILGARGFLLGKKPIQTHRIVAGDIAVDITTIEGSIEEDLHRRDLTINATAYSIGDGTIIDPLHGFKDYRGADPALPQEGIAPRRSAEDGKSGQASCSFTRLHP